MLVVAQHEHPRVSHARASSRVLAVSPVAGVNVSDVILRR
jgi:hypothetical protein